jgi:hypothetical protein
MTRRERFMRKIASFLAVSLVALSSSAFALTTTTVEFDATPSDGDGDIRKNDCPAPVVFDSGMFDEFTPPVGCASAFSAGCFVAAPLPEGLDSYWRFGADDFFTNGETLSHAKLWGRYNAEGYLAGARVSGFCVKIYEVPGDVYCPDGSLPNEDAIGTLVYDQYVGAGSFVEQELFTGLIRNFNYCLTLPVPFPTTAGQVYFFSAAADYILGDFEADPTAPDDGSQWFWRAHPGSGATFCEAAVRYCDDPTACENWVDISTRLALPCWEGWEASLVLYGSAAAPTGACCDATGLCSITEEAACQGIFYGPGTTCDPSPCEVIPTENTSWGNVKARFSN